MRTAAEAGGPITVHEGDALDLLGALRCEQQQPFDFVFVDANKLAYTEYYEQLVGGGLLASEGVAVFDNTLFFGDVVQAEAGTLPPKARMAKAVHAFNTMVHADERTTQVMLPLGDGVTVVRRR